MNEDDTQAAWWQDENECQHMRELEEELAESSKAIRNGCQRTIQHLKHCTEEEKKWT